MRATEIEKITIEANEAKKLNVEVGHPNAAIITYYENKIMEAAKKGLFSIIVDREINLSIRNYFFNKGFYVGPNILPKGTCTIIMWKDA